MSESKLTPRPWTVAAESGEWWVVDADYNELPATRENAVMQAAAHQMHDEMQRYLVILERAESLPNVWNFLTKGTGIATANGYRNAIKQAIA